MVVLVPWVALVSMPVQAHRHGMYATRAEAEKRAMQLQCQGVYAIGDMWMPCASERALHEALQKER